MDTRNVAPRSFGDASRGRPPFLDTADDTSRIIMVDPAVVGQSHLLVNTGFIRLLLGRFDEVMVIAETTHCAALETYLRDEVNLDRVRFISYAGRTQMLKLLREAIACRRAEAVLFTNLHYGLFAELNLLPLPRKAALYWVLHSHLSSLARTDLRNRIKNWLKINLLFNLFPGNSFIVCGESIKDGFLKLWGGLKSRRKINAVFHPVGLSARVADRPAANTNREPRAVTSLIYIQGWHRPTPEVRSTLEQLTRIAQARAMRLDVVWNNFSDTQNRKHFTKDYRDRIREIAEADFFLFLPSDEYSLQASGALLDLVVAATPAIGIKTAFGTELAQLIGEFGFFFATFDEILAFMTTIDTDVLLSRKAEFQRNLQRGVAAIEHANAAQLSRLGSSFSTRRADAWAACAAD